SFLVDRNGKRLNLEVKIAERSVVWKNQLQASGEGPETPPPPAKLGPVKFGILITGVKAKDRQELDIPSKEGVKVISVDPGSFADDIGVEQGDVILSVNRRPVRLPGDMVKLEAKLKPGQAVAFHIVRAQNGGPVRTYLAGKLPQR
ncbi:MAG: PDZ domain-containing protein, partial [Bryobacteraceae bacterium]